MVSCWGPSPFQKRAHNVNVTGTSALSGPNQVSRIADSCFPTMARMNTHHSEEDMRSHRLSLIGLNSKRLSNRLDDDVPQNRMPATMVRVYTLQSINDQQLATLITLGGETIQVIIAGNPFEVTVNDICELANWHKSSQPGSLLWSPKLAL